MILRNSILLLFSILLCFGCGKFDNGGSIRKADFNLTVTWYLKNFFLLNGDNNHFLLKNYQETYYEDSMLIIAYDDTFGNHYLDTGLWFWTNDKRFIHYEAIDSLNFLGVDSLIFAHEDIKVEKLTGEEFNIVFFQNGLTHRLEFVSSLAEK